jgi:hypothetical protein
VFHPDTITGSLDNRRNDENSAFNIYYNTAPLTVSLNISGSSDRIGLKQPPFDSSR